MSDKLTLDASAATAAGMSYGKWKVLHPETIPEKPKTISHPRCDIRECPTCGKQFQSYTTRKYCNNECYRIGQKKLALERYYKKKQEREKNQ